MRADQGKFDVAISGGGFVGLALVLALSRARPGLAIAAIDPLPRDEALSRERDGRASALTRASVNLLKTLGVWERVAGDAQAMRRIDITDTGLAAEVRPPLLQFDTELEPGEPAAHVLENHKLLSALLDTALQASGVESIPDAVAGLDRMAHGVELTLHNGAGIRSALAVAADGRRSRLRELSGIRTVGWSYPQSGIVATIDHERPHNGLAVQHFLPSGPFAFLPLPGNRSSLVWSEDRDEARRIMALGDDDFLAEVSLRFGGRFGKLALAGPRGSWPLDLHMARSFVRERVALAGDAAHGVHPLAGQGLNIGLRDVAALAQVIVDAARLGLDIGDASVLARYERWRRFDSAFLAFAMDGMNRLFSSDAPGLRMVRSFGLGLVDRAPSLKRFFVAEAAGAIGEVPKLLRGQPI
ncbi:MAG: FAD-dependent monooxygenase [Pseudomonadota bacterium]|nr:FAD-dependent monooxygenase [Pseudomonadota bacterium]